MTVTRFAIGGMALISFVVGACGRDAQARQDSAMAEPRVVRMSDAGISGTLDAITASEIDAARLAAAKAANPDVRAYAQQLVRDHEQMQRDGAELAKRHDLGAEQTSDAAAIRARGKSLVDTLNTLSGQAFDMTYVDEQVADHQAALQALHAWQRYADERELREQLRKARPIVQAHYDHAMALLPGLIPAGEPSVWKKHLGMPDAASGKPASRKPVTPTR